MSASIRQLIKADATSVKQLRLSVLQSDPMSFSITLGEEMSLPDQAESLGNFLQGADAQLFGYFSDGILTGMIGAERCSGMLHRHKARIFGLYVETTSRNQGIGSALVDTALEAIHSWSGIEKATLETTSASHAALSIYKKHGFSETKVEKNALKYPDRYVD